MIICKSSASGSNYHDVTAASSSSGLLDESKNNDGSYIELHDDYDSISTLDHPLNSARPSVGISQSPFASGGVHGNRNRNEGNNVFSNYNDYDEDSISSSESSEFESVSRYSKKMVENHAASIQGTTVADFNDDHSSLTPPTMYNKTSRLNYMYKNDTNKADNILANTIALHTSFNSQQWKSMELSEHDMSDLSGIGNTADFDAGSFQTSQHSTHYSSIEKQENIILTRTNEAKVQVK